MSIKKQEFYEGAALHILARSGNLTSVRYETPFFYFNKNTAALLKYSTKTRSPWGFTFTAEEQILLRDRAKGTATLVALICGSDGIASLSYELYANVARIRMSSLHVACYRSHGEHYEVCGPDGTLAGKVAPSAWQRILGTGGREHEAL